MNGSSIDMAASPSSVLSFNSTNSRTICRNRHESRPSHGQVSAFSRTTQLPSSGLWMSNNPHGLGRISSLSDSDGDRVAVDTADKGPALPLDPAERSTSQSNGAVPILEAGSDQSLSPKSPAKRSPLTARERLRAARVLSRYSEAKPAPKLKMGSKVLDALKESDGGKRRSGLPEAPTNLFDDSKRGLPKAGLTFSFPGGFDLFVVAFSFVFITTVMFGTTYLVWKVGAIHFNEY